MFQFIQSKYKQFSFSMYITKIYTGYDYILRVIGFKR